MNAAVEVQDTPTGVVKIELAIDTATQHLADAEASLEQLRARRKRVLVAEGAGELQNLRKAALVMGDDREVDRLDAEIGDALDRLDADIATGEKLVARENDRLGVLREDLAEAKTLEQQRSMDALFNRADAARKIAEALIRNEYADLSQKLVDVLSTLVAIDRFIDESNTVLAGRTRTAPVDALNRRIADPNNIRRIPDEIIPASKREVERCVGGGNTFPREYRYETVIEEVPEKRIHGTWRPKLFDECVIASNMVGAPAWDKYGTEKAEAEKRYEQIIDALL